MKMPRLISARTALCVAIVALCPQPQKAASSHTSFVSWPSSPKIILCDPGLVFRCTSLGCFCVKP
jgi:hypothetical protein